MTFETVILDGTIVTSTHMERADIGIRNGKIVEIGDLHQASAAEIVRAEGLHVLPGLIDSQVHFREPGLTHKEDIGTGTLSAICGGVTSILEMPNTNPNTISAEALAGKLAIAAKTAWCHYGFFVGASPENAEQLGELEALPGTPGIKIFMGSSTGSLLVDKDDDLRRVLLHGRKRCPVHSEDEARNRERKAFLSNHPHAREHPFLRDAESARLSTERLLRLSEETGRPVHVLHISTADEIPLIMQAKRKGLGTTMEVLPQHLYFAAPDCYERLGSLAQMNPPIRDTSHQNALWNAVKRGWFDVFGSDHAPHTLEEKAQTYPASPSGMPGVQTLLSVLTTFVARAQIGIQDVVRMACENPAKLYGIKGKGHLAPGFDADLVLLDLHKPWVVDRSLLKSKCGWSPYEGDTLIGWPTQVFLNGKRAAQDMNAPFELRGQQLDFGGLE